MNERFVIFSRTGSRAVPSQLTDKIVHELHFDQGIYDTSEGRAHCDLLFAFCNS